MYKKYIDTHVLKHCCNYGDKCHLGMVCNSFNQSRVGYRRGKLRETKIRDSWELFIKGKVWRKNIINPGYYL